MTLLPLSPLLAASLAPQHAIGLGFDELLPAGLAVLMAIGVYTLISSGGREDAAGAANQARNKDDD